MGETGPMGRRRDGAVFRRVPPPGKRVPCVGGRSRLESYLTVKMSHWNIGTRLNTNGHLAAAQRIALTTMTSIVERKKNTRACGPLFRSVAPAS